MFQTVANDDQLAIILSHELSHAILGHSVSKALRLFECLENILSFCIIARNAQLVALSGLVPAFGRWFLRCDCSRYMGGGVVNGCDRESRCQGKYWQMLDGSDN